MSYLKITTPSMMLLSECVSAIIYGDLLFFLCTVQSKEKFAIQILLW